MACAMSLACPAERPKERAPVAGKGKKATMASPMEQAFNAVVKGCEISLYGKVTKGSCTPTDALVKLAAAETQLGSNVALGLYCKTMAGGHHLARALASHRLATIAGKWRSAKKAVNREVYTCLVGLLPKMKEAYRKRHAERLAEVIGFMGPLLGETERAARLIGAQADHSVRARGYRALWAHGRQGALPILKKALGDHDVVVENVIGGFGQGLKADTTERDAICDLVARKMKGQKARVCQVAVYHVARHCGRAHHAAVLDAARAAIGKRFFGWHISYALRDVARWKGPEKDRSRVTKVLKILALAVDDQELDGSSRSYALATLYELDAARGKVLARRFSGGCPGALRKKARALMAKK